MDMFPGVSHVLWIFCIHLNAEENRMEGWKLADSCSAAMSALAFQPWASSAKGKPLPLKDAADW